MPKDLNAVIRAWDADRKVDLDKVKLYGDYGDMIADRDKRMRNAEMKSALSGALGAGR